MNTLLKRCARGAFNAIGLDVGRRCAPHPANEGSTADLRRARIIQNAGVSLLLDVGANEGQYALAVRAAGYSGRIASFEPLSDAFQILSSTAASKPPWAVWNVALGPADSTAELHVAGNSMSSSFLPMSNRHRELFPESLYVGSRNVPIRKLDSMRAELFLEHDRVYCKLDVQGFESSVLQGATDSIASVVAIEVEICLAKLYEGQTAAGEMISKLDSLGFDLVSLDNGDIDQDSGHVLWCDGIFQRRGC